MATSRISWRDWLLRRVWSGPTWEYTVLTVHHTLYREGGAPSMVRHFVVVLRDGVVQARVDHVEVVNPADDQRVQSAWFERYLSARLNDLGGQGWRLVSLAYEGPIRAIFLRRG